MAYGEASVFSSAGMVLSTKTRTSCTITPEQASKYFLICFCSAEIASGMLISDCSEMCTSTRMLSSSL